MYARSTSILRIASQTSMRPSVRTFTGSTTTLASSLPAAFRRAPTDASYLDAKDRLRKEHATGRLRVVDQAACWKIVAERWPLTDLLPTLSDAPKLSHLEPPIERVQVMRDIARRFLVTPTTMPHSLALLKDLQNFLQKSAPDDPFNLLLLLYASIALGQHQYARRISNIIKDHLSREEKWAFYPAAEDAPKAGTEEFGLTRKEVRRIPGADGALELTLGDVKVVIKVLDAIISKGHVETAGLKNLDWYSRLTPPANERFHRTRLQYYLEPRLTPTSSETQPSSPLPISHLNLFLAPALAHQRSDPIVLAYALTALHLVATSPSTPSTDQEAARAAFDDLLAKATAVLKTWSPDLPMDSEAERPSRKDRSRSKEALAVKCLETMVHDGSMTGEQKGMWDVVLGRQKS